MARERKSRTIETDIFGLPVSQDKKINSKRKGDLNERTVAKWLEEWTGVKFTRVPRSGGLRWQATANVCGDLVCEDSSFGFPFTIETKHLANITMGGVLRKKSKVFTVYEQCKSDCARSGRLPMLILRRNGMPQGEWIIFFEEQVANILMENNLFVYSLGTAPNGIRLVGFSSHVLKDMMNFDRFKELIIFAETKRKEQYGTK